MDFPKPTPAPAPVPAAGPGLYADIGKKARDLLNRDYITGQKFTLITTAANGAAEATVGSVMMEVKLKDLVPAATNTVNTTFIMVDKAPRPAHTNAHGREETCLSLVADDTTAVHFLLWGTECDAFEPGDILRLTSGIFSPRRGNNLVLRAGKRGRAEKVGEFTMMFVETPNMSEMRWGRDPGNPSKMVQEAVVSPYSQVFKPLH